MVAVWFLLSQVHLAEIKSSNISFWPSVTLHVVVLKQVEPNVDNQGSREAGTKLTVTLFKAYNQITDQSQTYFKTVSLEQTKNMSCQKGYKPSLGNLTYTRGGGAHDLQPAALWLLGLTSDKLYCCRSLYTVCCLDTFYYQPWQLLACLCVSSREPIILQTFTVELPQRGFKHIGMFF